MKGGRIPLRLRLVSAVLAMTVLFSNVCAEAPPVPAPQPLADILEAFAKSTGYQLVYRADLTAGLTSTGVPPNTPPVEALRQLLRGTGLEFSFVNSRTIVISRSTAGAGRANSASAPVAHRPDTMTNADARGKDGNPDTSDARDQNSSHRGLFARIAELFAVCGSASMAGISCTQDAATLSRSGLEEVVVTGTRQSGLQVVASLAPIQILSAEALEQAGGGQDLMGTLAQVVPSLTLQAYGVDMAAQTLQAKLRGLSPNDVLVLIDGKRRHTTANLAVASGSPYQGGASVDLNFIPLDAIDHILGSQCSLAGTRLDLDQMLRRIQSVKGQLRYDGVTIRGERRFLDQHPIAFEAGAKETHHHQMQIHRQRIHGDHLALMSADEGRKRCCSLLVIADPRTRRDVMPEHSQALPVLQLLFDILRRRFGLKPQRVTAEIHQSPS